MGLAQQTQYSSMHAKWPFSVLKLLSTIFIRMGQMQDRAQDGSNPRPIWDPCKIKFFSSFSLLLVFSHVRVFYLFQQRLQKLFLIIHVNKLPDILATQLISHSQLGMRLSTNDVNSGLHNEAGAREGINRARVDNNNGIMEADFIR